MAQKLSADLPPDLDLSESWVLQFAAVDPVDGSDIAGVTISNVSIVCEMVGGGSGTVSLDVEALLVPQAGG